MDANRKVRGPVARSQVEVPLGKLRANLHRLVLARHAAATSAGTSASSPTDVSSASNDVSSSRSFSDDRPSSSSPSAQVETYSAADSKRGEELVDAVILLSTGAYSPVHRMHAEVFEVAKEHLEKSGCVVLAGFLSPSSDRYVRGKLGADYIPGVHRVEMIKLAVADSSWLELSDWEITHTGWGSPTKLLNHVAAYVEENVHGLRVRPIYVCGADHVVKYKQFQTKMKKEVLVVVRPGYEKLCDMTSEYFEAHKGEPDAELTRRVFHIVHSKHQVDVSSTELRRRLRRGEDISDITCDRVAEYLRVHRQEFGY